MKQPLCQLCFAQHWKELQFCDANVAPGAALNSPHLPTHTHTHTHTHTPLLSASSLFLPKPRRPLRPQGQLVWHRIPSPPPLLNLLLPHIYSAKQSFTYLASFLFPLQCHNLWHRPGTVTILIKNVPKLVPCSTELVKQYVLPPPSVLLNAINETLLRGNVDSHPGEVYFDPDCLQ